MYPRSTTSLISFLDYNKNCLSWGERIGYIHLANTCPIDSFLTSLNLCNSDVDKAIEISDFDLKSHPQVQRILFQLVQKVRLTTTYLNHLFVHVAIHNTDKLYTKLYLEICRSKN